MYLSHVHIHLWLVSSVITFLLFKRNSWRKKNVKVLSFLLTRETRELILPSRNLCTFFFFLYLNFFLLGFFSFRHSLSDTNKGFPHFVSASSTSCCQIPSLSDCLSFFCPWEKTRKLETCYSITCQKHKLCKQIKRLSLLLMKVSCSVFIRQPATLSRFSVSRETHRFDERKSKKQHQTRRILSPQFHPYSLNTQSIVCIPWGANKILASQEKRGHIREWRTYQKISMSGEKTSSFDLSKWLLPIDWTASFSKKQLKEDSPEFSRNDLNSQSFSWIYRVWKTSK